MQKNLTYQELKRKILAELRVELADEFDKNFERKAFFSQNWKPRQNPNARGTLLMVKSQMCKYKSDDCHLNVFLLFLRLKKEKVMLFKIFAYAFVGALSLGFLSFWFYYLKFAFLLIKGEKKEPENQITIKINIKKTVED